MKLKIALPIAFVLSAASAAAIVRLQADDGFNKFYANLQNAVKTDDREKVADTISFDRFTWEATDSLRQIKTREAFLKNYAKMFTQAIKAKIATAKPKKTDSGNYYIQWHAATFEYELYFGRQQDGSYRFEGLTVGPY